MTPLFLPHTVLDTLCLPGDELLPVAPEAYGRLRQLRDQAIADGAQVLLVSWPGGAWALLAVEVPAGVVIEDAAQLIPNLLGNPEALEQMRRGSLGGQHLHWLNLSRPTATLH